MTSQARNQLINTWIGLSTIGIFAIIFQMNAELRELMGLEPVSLVIKNVRLMHSSTVRYIH